MVFNIRIVLTSILFSLAVVPALAQTDLVCNNIGITEDCTQFITEFCADVANVKAEGYEEIYRCYEASGFMCELTAYNTHDPARNPSEEHCEIVLDEVAKSCPKGGEARFAPNTQFIYTIAPDERTTCPIY